MTIEPLRVGKFSSTNPHLRSLDIKVEAMIVQLAPGFNLINPPKGTETEHKAIASHVVFASQLDDSHS